MVSFFGGNIFSSFLGLCKKDERSILPSRNMDTSSSYIVDNTELQTLILASIQTLKRNNKKCGTEEVFQLVLESLHSDIDKESKILEFRIKNQKVKTRCYANKTCL